MEKRTTFGRTMDITVSIISVSPVRSAVDMYSASRGSLGIWVPTIVQLCTYSPYWIRS